MPPKKLDRFDPSQHLLYQYWPVRPDVPATVSLGTPLCASAPVFVPAAPPGDFSEPDMVASPCPFDFSFPDEGLDTYFDQDVYIEGEGSVGSGLVPAAEDFIPVHDFQREVETPETVVTDHYWQRHTKNTARRAVRRFLITGFAKWGKNRITSDRELAHFIDKQVIETETRRVKVNRQWWEKKVGWGRTP